MIDAPVVYWLPRLFCGTQEFIGRFFIAHCHEEKWRGDWSIDSHCKHMKTAGISYTYSIYSDVAWWPTVCTQVNLKSVNHEIYATQAGSVKNQTTKGVCMNRKSPRFSRVHSMSNGESWKAHGPTRGVWEIVRSTDGAPRHQVVEWTLHVVLKHFINERQQLSHWSHHARNKVTFDPQLLPRDAREQRATSVWPSVECFIVSKGTTQRQTINNEM